MNQINKTLDDKNDEIAVLSTKYSDISKKNKESEFDLEDIRKIKEVMDIKLKNSYEEANRLEINKEELLGGHAVLVCGYNDVTPKWIVRNSWGSSWGDNGYFYLYC